MKNVLTISEVVYLSEKECTEAYNTVKEGGGSDTDAAAAAAVAWRLSLPALTSRPSALAYLALLVRGMEMRFVGQREARLMVAAVRAWLQASQPAKVVSQ